VKTAAYREDLAHIHDIGYGAIAEDAAARLLAELSGRAPAGGLVVDLGCGSGILAAALTAAGHRVLGIDLSASMIAIARGRAPAAEFRVGSFVNASLPRAVAVTAVGEVVNYLFDEANDDKARSDLFRRVHDALEPGGVFLFDAAGPERERPGGTRRGHASGPGWAVLVDVTLDPATRVLTRDITTSRQVGSPYRRDREVHRLVLLEPAAVRRSLEEAGFTVEILTRYHAAALPEGVIAFAARKPAPVVERSAP